MKTKHQLDVTCYFYFTSYAHNMFRTLIYPSSGAYGYSVELPACNTDAMPTQSTPKHQHTSNQEHTANVVIQQNSRKLLMMDILMSATYWAHKKRNKHIKWHQAGLFFSTILFQCTDVCSPRFAYWVLPNRENSHLTVN